MELLWIGIVLVWVAVVRALRFRAGRSRSKVRSADEPRTPVVPTRRRVTSIEELNPTTGLPMLLGLSFGDDISGTPYGGLPGDTDDAWSNPGESIHAFDRNPRWSWADESDDMLWVNPATGLRMTSGGPHGYDVGGNPYGLSNADHSLTGCGDPDISGDPWARNGSGGLEEDFTSSSSMSGIDDGFGLNGSSSFGDDLGGSYGSSGFDGGGSNWD